MAFFGNIGMGSFNPPIVSQPPVIGRKPHIPVRQTAPHSILDVLPSFNGGNPNNNMVVAPRPAVIADAQPLVDKKKHAIHGVLIAGATVLGGSVIGLDTVSAVGLGVVAGGGAYMWMIKQ